MSSNKILFKIGDLVGISHWMGIANNDMFGIIINYYVIGEDRVHYKIITVDEARLIVLSEGRIHNV